MAFIASIVARHPELKRKLYTAALDITPEEYVSKKVKSAAQLSIMIGVLIFFIVAKKGGSLILPFAVAGIFYVIFFRMQMRQVDAMITKRKKEIDKDVLFAGRFLLVKLNSGTPLVNALEEASKSYGIANEFFKEIVKDIDLGTPLERALDKATENSPSDKLKKILFQISNALKIGIDVTDFLEAILDDIAEQQLIEIQRYGKKLNGLTMFYMLFAIVMPSLGMTMIVIIASLISIKMNLTAFSFVVVLLIFLQVIFLTMFQSIRPNVNI